MMNRNKLPKFNLMSKCEKMMIISSLFFAFISIIVMLLFKLKVIKCNIYFFGFSITILLVAILYYKYDRITSMVGFLLALLFIGMGLKELGL